MKVLHVTAFYEPAWSMGGVVRGTSLLCRTLSALGLDVTVYTTDSAGSGRLDVPINQPVDVGGVKVYYFYTATPKTVYYSRALAKACRESLSTFDLVHTATLWDYLGIVVGAEARKQRVPHVFSTDGAVQEGELKRSHLKKLVFLKLFEMRNLRGAAAIRYVSEVEREQTAHLGLQTPSFMIPHGLDFREFEHLPERRVARAELEVADDAQVVGYLGRLHLRKAVDFLIRGFARIAQQLPSAVLLVAGPDHGDEARLRALVRQLGLNERVRFLGYVGPEGRARLLSAADLMTLIGLEGECFGYGAVEAAAAGVPILMSRHVGVARTLKEDGAGVIVAVDEVAIAAELKRLLSAPALLSRMGQNGYRSVRKHYDINVVTQKMVIAYEDVLTGRRSPECQWSVLNYCTAAMTEASLHSKTQEIK